MYKRQESKWSELYNQVVSKYTDQTTARFMSVIEGKQYVDWSLSIRSKLRALDTDFADLINEYQLAKLGIEALIGGNKHVLDGFEL